MMYLLISLLIVLVLVVLYWLARKVKTLGQALAFVCVVGSRIVVKVAEGMNSAATFCKNTRLDSLRYPPGITDHDYWRGLDVMARISYFVLAVLVFGGEVINALLVIPAIQPTAHHFDFPGIVDIASAALFICCPAFFGAIILECWEKIPQGAGLFLPMGKLSRWALGIIALALLIVSGVMNFFFYQFRAFYLIDPQSAQEMIPSILGGLSIVVTATAPFAFWAVYVGGMGVVSLIMLLSEPICRIIAGALSLLPSLLDVVAMHLTQGAMSVYGDFLGHDPYKAPASPFPAPRLSAPGQTIAGVLPQSASSLVDADNLEHVVPIESTITEVSMSNLGKNTTFVFADDFGSRMFPHVSRKIVELRASGSILTSAHLDVSVTQMQTAIPGVVDLSPTQATRHTALLHSNTKQHAYHTLFNSLADRLVETHLETKTSPAPMIFWLDCRVLSDAVDALESIKRRLPLHSVVVVTSLSSLDSHQQAVQTGIADMERLHAEDVLETVIVSAPNSSFATRNGEETQHLFLGHTLVSLVIAHSHSPHNRSFVNVLHDLHTHSPFTAVSFASEPVATGLMPKRWSWVPGMRNKAGTGNFGDILSQTRSAIDRVIANEDTRTFPAQVSTDAQVAILSCVPIALNDPRHAECVRDNEVYVGTHYPNATSLTVRGNGCAYPHHIGGRFLVQASCLYPLQPASLVQFQEGQNIQAARLYPVTTTLEQTSTNGHVPAQQKRATRRVGRKNMKSAM